MAQGGGRTDAAGDTVIVRAAIHPAIGIGRVGNSPDQFFCGPEVSYPTPRHPGFYRDANGALKRQAARFRILRLQCRGRRRGGTDHGQFQHRLVRPAQK